MTVQVTQCKPETTATVRVNFTGAPVIEVPYAGREIAPYYAVLTYEYRVSTDDAGWTSHSWFCTDADLVGHRVLKPGPNGEVRISSTTKQTAIWSVFGGNGKDLTVVKRGELPEFVVRLIEELRPSGEVRTLTL